MSKERHEVHGESKFPKQFFDQLLVTSQPKLKQNVRAGGSPIRIGENAVQCLISSSVFNFSLGLEHFFCNLRDLQTRLIACCVSYLNAVYLNVLEKTFSHFCVDCQLLF